MPAHPSPRALADLRDRAMNGNAKLLGLLGGVQAGAVTPAMLRRVDVVCGRCCRGLEKAILEADGQVPEVFAARGAEPVLETLRRVLWWCRMYRLGSAEPPVLHRVCDAMEPAIDGLRSLFAEKGEGS